MLWLLAAAALCLNVHGAFAHAMLERASPPVGAVVPSGPPALTLTFTEAVEPAFSRVTVTDSGGHRVDQPGMRSEADGTVLVVPLPPLPPGAYQVEWRVTSVDTHRTQGHFSFSIKR